MQANYPVTTGLIPRVYKRPWPIVAIMLRPAHRALLLPEAHLRAHHVSIFLPEIMWARGETVPVEVKVVSVSKITAPL